MGEKMTDKTHEKFLAPVSPVIGIGRSLLALSQASVLIFSDTRSFFVPVGETTFELACNSFLGKASLFCAVPDLQIASALHIVMFLVVASGVLPGYTCFIHVYASYSFLAPLALPDGGDMIAGSLALILVFAYAGDQRRTHWSEFGARGVIATGISEGAQFAIKVQVAYIYLHSATAKFPVEAWADGSEMYLVTRQEMFGTSGWIGDIARLVTAQPFMTLALSWGAVMMELAIVALIFIPGRNAARVAILLAAGLHLAIIALIGLGSFGLIMIGAVLCATGSKFTNMKSVFHVRNLLPHPPVTAVEQNEPSVNSMELAIEAKE